MSASKKTDWLSLILWIIGGALLLTFLYQLLKLLQSAGAQVANIPTAVGQAFTNTIAAVENALTGGVANFSLLSLIPNFFSLLWSFLGTLDPTGILGTIGSFFSNLFAGTAPAITTGSGAAATGAVPNNSITTSQLTSPAAGGTIVGGNDGNTFSVGTPAD